MPRTSIILLGVALALLSFIVLFERGSLTTTEREGRKGHVLDSFVKSRVTRIELQRRGVTTVLQQVEPDPNDPLDAGGWHVEAPYRAKADKIVVDELLGALEWAEARRSVGEASAADLSRFGLSSPRYRVSFLAGKDLTTFSVGLPAANGGGSYVQVKGRPEVFVVGGDLLDQLEQVPEDFHDKSFHEALTVYTLRGLQLTDAVGAVRKVVDRDDFFWLESPYASLASTPALTDLVNALDAMKAQRYVSTDVHPEYALEKPRFTLVMNSLVYDRKLKSQRTDERLELRIGGVCGEHADELYMQVEKAGVYCIAASEAAKLDISAEALRETRLLPIDDAVISAVELHAGARELTLQTNDQSTRFRIAEQGRELASALADSKAVSEWYAALRSVAVERTSPLDAAQRAQLSKSAWVATFKRSKTQPPYVLHMAQAADGELTAWRLDEPVLLHLPESARPLFTLIGARFHKKRVLDENEAQFSGLTVTYPQGAREHVVKDSASGYALDAPATGPAERAVVDDILRMVSKLDVVRFVADQPAPEHGLATPYRKLEIEYSAGGEARKHALTIGDKSGERDRFAQLDGDSAVFVIAGDLVDRLKDSLAKRASAASQ